jgi:hypothetical protein
MSKIEKRCKQCGKRKKKYKSELRGKNFFCSLPCRNEWQRENLTGKNNPNYKDGKASEQQYCPVCNKEIDGRSKHCRRCSPHLKIGQPHTEETKRLLASKAKDQYTNAYREEHRRLMEDLGYWIPKEHLPDWRIYFREANWIDTMFDRANKAEKALIAKIGTFNTSSNTKGAVRDHAYSRNSGFIAKVPPEILRHPCNCSIISHAANMAKRKPGTLIDDDSQTLEELIDRIINYSGKWKEQKVCLRKIEDYRNGFRWERKEK